MKFNEDSRVKIPTILHLMRLGYEYIKAWSQNLGHEGVLTTFYSYGEVQQDRQSQIIKRLKLSDSVDNKETAKLAKEFLDKMNELANA